MIGFGFGLIVTADDGERLMVVGYYPLTRSYGFVRVPVGMDAMDLGRRFWSAPTRADPTAYSLIDPHDPRNA